MAGIATILSLPPEIWHNIFIYTSPIGLAHLIATCSTFNSYIQHDVQLWKHMYLENFVSTAVIVR